MQPMQSGDVQTPPPLLELLAAVELEDAALEEAPVADDDTSAEDELACIMPPAPLACCDEDACELEPLPPAPLLASGPSPPAESEHAATATIAQETKTKDTSPRCIPPLSRREDAGVTQDLEGTDARSDTGLVHRSASLLHEELDTGQRSRASYRVPGMRTWTWIAVAVGFSETVGCGSSAPRTREGLPATSSSAEPSPVAIAPRANIHPVPAKLQEVAAQSGITMKDDWQWTELERMRTQFDWSGRPEGRAFKAHWSFWVKGEDMRQMKPFLPAVVQSAALNLTRSTACDPFEQPAELARMVGADRVITVCFEPAPHVTEEFRRGVLHGLVRGDVLVIVIVLSNDRTGTVPLPDHLGGRFSP